MLTDKDRKEIAFILSRRANEIASFSSGYVGKSDHYGSVELALTREMERLRQLAFKVDPPVHDDDDD
jgi:hypothetical protein